MAQTIEKPKAEKAAAAAPVQPKSVAIPAALTMEFAKKNFNRPDELFKKVSTIGGFGDLGDDFMHGASLDLSGLKDEARAEVKAAFAEHTKANAADLAE